jgi:hypothetical protein
MHDTTFMIAFAIGEYTAPAQRLYKIVMASDAVTGWSLTQQSDRTRSTPNE